MTWTAVTIRSLCERTGTTDPRRRPDVAFRYIDISGIDRDLKRIGTAAEVMGADAPSRARQVVKARDVLVSTVRPNLNAVAMVPDDLDGEVASTGFCILRAMEQLLDPRFLFYFTRTDRFVNALLQHVRGANYPAVTDRNVHDVEIPWPAKSEQQRIVEILDQADALRQKRRAADEKAQRILPALYHKLFGDPLASVNKGDGIALGELDIDLQNGFACGEKDVEDGVPHLRMNNIDDEGVMNLDLVRTVPTDRDGERYRLAEGDVLFMGTNSEDKIGKTCLFVPPDVRPYLFSNHLIRLRVSDSRVTPEYVAGFLHLLWAKGFYPSIAKRWVNQSSVSQAALAGVCIPIPSRKELQLFTHTYRELLRMRSSRVGYRLRIDRLFDVLLHRAFTGELTAKWREANRAKLEAELQQQMAALGEADSDAPRRGRKRKAVN
jgi:type I restriction enzyme S subunit